MGLNFRGALGALVAASGLLAATPSAWAADFVMKVSSPAPLTDVDPLSAWMRAFEAGVEEASGGRIDVQLYPSSQLGPIPATVEGVAMGTIEMTMPAIGFMVGVDPRFQVLDSDGLFDDEYHALKTLNDPAVRAMLADFGANAGVEPMMIWTSGQSVLVTRDPVGAVADLDGKKIRTAGNTPLVIKPLEAMGVAPVAMPLGDVLPGIQTGQIDGTTLNLPVAVGFKFADVAKNVTYMPKKFAIIGGIVSRDFMARIGPDLEGIVREQAIRANEAFAGKLDSGPQILEGAWGKAGGTLHRFEGAERDNYLSIARGEVEKIMAADAELKAVYDVIMQAAEANR